MFYKIFDFFFFFFYNQLVTARKGVGLVCAGKGLNRVIESRVIESGQNEDDVSGEDESDSDQSNIKTEKVKHTVSHSVFENGSLDL